MTHFDTSTSIEISRIFVCGNEEIFAHYVEGSFYGSPNFNTRSSFFWLLSIHLHSHSSKQANVLRENPWEFLKYSIIYLCGTTPLFVRTNIAKKIQFHHLKISFDQLSDVHRKNRRQIKFGNTAKKTIRQKTKKNKIFFVVNRFLLHSHDSLGKLELNLLVTSSNYFSTLFIFFLERKDVCVVIDRVEVTVTVTEFIS